MLSMIWYVSPVAGSVLMFAVPKVSEDAQCRDGNACGPEGGIGQLGFQF